MFSVVIPLFDKAGYIERTLDSVAAQTVAPAEIIVVNDGSTDGGDAVARAAADRSSVPIRVIDQPNRGVSAARNAGIAAASEPFIAFLDADDRWLPEFLARMKSLIESHPGAVLYGSGFITIRNGRPERHYGIRPSDLINADRGHLSGRSGTVDFFKASSRGIVTNSSSIVVPRSALESGGGFPEGVTVMEDHMLWTSLALQGPVALVAEPLTAYDVSVPGQAIDYWRREYVERFDVLAYHRFLAVELRERTAARLTGPADASFAAYARGQLRTAALQRLYWGRFDALRTFWREFGLDGLHLGRGGKICSWVVRHPLADGIVAATMWCVRTIRTVLRRVAGSRT